MHFHRHRFKRQQWHLARIPCPSSCTSASLERSLRQVALFPLPPLCTHRAEQLERERTSAQGERAKWREWQRWKVEPNFTAGPLMLKITRISVVRSNLVMDFNTDAHSAWILTLYSSDFSPPHWLFWCYQLSIVSGTFVLETCIVLGLAWVYDVTSQVHLVARANKKLCPQRLVR